MLSNGPAVPVNVGEVTLVRSTEPVLPERLVGRTEPVITIGIGATAALLVKVTLDPSTSVT